MKKWLWRVPLILLALRWLAIESFELYSEVPVCDEREKRQGAMTRSCGAYDQVLAGEYKVRKGQVFWEDREYSPEKTCGLGMSSFIYNLFSFKCHMEMNGYGRTVEHRTLTKVEKLSPTFKVLEGVQSGMLDWQKQQYSKYAISEQGVYFEGALLKGVNPADFNVIFPLGNEEYWRFLDIYRSGESTFVSGDNLGDIDLRHLRLLEPPPCVKPGAQCTEDKLGQLFRDKGGVIGSVGKDFIVLGAYRSARVKNKAAPDMYTFSYDSNRYVHTQGELYQVSAQRDEPLINSDGGTDYTEWFRPVYKPSVEDSKDYLPWQKEKFLNYAVTDDSVYFKGRRLEGANPKAFKVVFPFGPEAAWGALNLSTSGSDSFVGHWKVEDADFEKLLMLPPCSVSDDGVTGDCWTSQQVANSIDDEGMVAQLGQDIFYFRRNSAQRIKAAVSPGFYVFMRGYDLWLSTGALRYEFRRGGYGFDEIDLRKIERSRESTNDCHSPSSAAM